MTQGEWDYEAEVLRDDGYGQNEIERLLGPRPGLLATEASYRHGKAERGARTLRLLASTDPLIQRQRPAPSIPTLSWDGKRDRLAEKMAAMRGLHWASLSYEARAGLLSLAEFVLLAVAAVEEDVRRVKTRPMR